MNDLLFVYGSLLSASNYFANYLSENAEIVSTGTFEGILYDIGEYPGAVSNETNSYPITGTIFKLHHPEKALEVLDDYEGFGPEQEQPNLFIRESRPVTTSKSEINCWIYLYNLPVDDLTVISSGDYQQYLKSKA